MALTTVIGQKDAVLSIPDIHRSSREPDAAAPGHDLGAAAEALGRRIWHAGDIDGFSTWLAHYPDVDVTIAVLQNSESADIDESALHDAVRAAGAGLHAGRFVEARKLKWVVQAPGTWLDATLLAALVPPPRHVAGHGKKRRDGQLGRWRPEIGYRNGRRRQARVAEAIT